MVTSDHISPIFPQMAVFDIDGTITLPNSSTVSQDVVNGLKYLRSKGVITTISTGRPYIRMKQIIAENFDEIIDDKALISVEHGAKIVDKWGRVVVESELSRQDIDELIEFTRLNIDMVKFLAYNPASVSRKTQIWCPDVSDIHKTRQERGWYAKVLEGSLSDIKKQLYDEPISNVTLKLKIFIHVQNLKIEFVGGSIKAIFQDGALEFLKSKVNKAHAITYMCEQLKIKEGDILVAGNAINDVDMLNMKAGHRILISPDGEGYESITGYLNDKRDIIHIKTSNELGQYLQRL